VRAAGDLQAHPVPACEPVGGRPEVDADRLRGSRAAARPSAASAEKVISPPDPKVPRQLWMTTW
jgi:hypothetical protein